MSNELDALINQFFPSLLVPGRIYRIENEVGYTCLLVCIVDGGYYDGWLVKLGDSLDIGSIVCIWANPMNSRSIIVSVVDPFHTNLFEARPDISERRILSAMGIDSMDIHKRFLVTEKDSNKIADGIISGAIQRVSYSYINISNEWQDADGNTLINSANRTDALAMFNRIFPGITCEPFCSAKIIRKPASG